MDVEELRQLIADNLSRLIDELGLTAVGWAKKAGLNHTGVRDIISGKIKHPTYKTLVLLAECVDIDVRRITVGPDFDSVAPEDAEILDLLSQLEPSERQFLLNAAKAQLSARDQSKE